MKRFVLFGEPLAVGEQQGFGAREVALQRNVVEFRFNV